MICNETLQIDSGYGYIREAPVERRQRDVRVHLIVEGIKGIMRLIIDPSGLRTCYMPGLQPIMFRTSGRTSLRRYSEVPVDRKMGTL
jgi:hypothetical protein